MMQTYNQEHLLLIPKTEADLEREAIAWLEAKEAALRRKKSNFKPRAGAKPTRMPQERL
jgi:hypothetical protein